MTLPDFSWDALINPGQSTAFFDLDPLPEYRPAPPGFCISTAWWMAALCHAAYLEPQDKVPPGRLARETVLQSVGFTEVRDIDHEAIQGVLVRNSNSYILAFRGTDTPQDWTTNVQLSWADWPGGGKIHTGFGQAFEGVAGLILSLTRRYHDLPWQICGHSLGAAMAVLSAILVDPVAVYAVGCPNLGDREFSTTFSSRQIFQLVNGRDLVTTIPPAMGDDPYCKPGRIIYLDGRLAIADPEPARLPAGTLDWNLAMKRVTSVGQWQKPVKDLYDHSIVNYLVSIEAAIRDSGN